MKGVYTWIRRFCTRTVVALQALTSPQHMELGSAGGVDLAAAAAGGPASGSCRSPVWFRSSAVADERQEAGKYHLQSMRAK